MQVPTEGHWSFCPIQHPRARTLGPKSNYQQMSPGSVTNTICCREQTGDQKLPLFQKKVKVIYWWESPVQCWRWSFSSLKKSYKPEGSLASSIVSFLEGCSPAHSSGLRFYSGWGGFPWPSLLLFPLVTLVLINMYSGSRSTPHTCSECRNMSVSSLCCLDLGQSLNIEGIQ